MFFRAKTNKNFASLSGDFNSKLSSSILINSSINFPKLKLTILSYYRNAYLSTIINRRIDITTIIKVRNERKCLYLAHEAPCKQPISFEQQITESTENKLSLQASVEEYLR